MWNYYNNPYSLQHQQQQHQQHPQEPGFQPGMGMGMNNSAMCHDPSEWWMSGDQGRGGNMQASEYPPGFRMPFNMQVPGPWALRGPRPRGERRGPGRPRLNTTSTKSSGSLMERSISAPSMGGGRARMMSPGLSPFSSGLGSTPGSIPSPDMDGMPMSPSGLGGSPDDDIMQKRPHPPSNLDMMSGSPGGMGPGDMPPVGKIGKASGNINKKRFTCEICQKRFSTAWYVRVHRKSHNGERPYTCETCGKGFMLPNVLLTHKKKCERQNPSGSTGLGSSGPAVAPIPNSGSSLPSNVNPTSSSPPILESDLHHQTSPLPHHPQQHYGMNDPFDRDDMGQMMGGVPPMARGGGMYPGSSVGVQSPQQSAVPYNQRFPGPGESSMPYHMGEQVYGNRDYMGGVGGVQGYGGALQQPLSPQYSYSPTNAGGGMRPPLGSDNSTSSGSSSLPPAPGSLASNNMQAHFLGDDIPPDKGGGRGGRLVGGELPPVNKLPPNHNENNNPYSCDQGSGGSSEDRLPKTTQRPYSCEICEKRFSQKCNLITHKRIHTGERPHTCPHCDKRFTQKGNLDAHLKTHSKEKPYPCGLCEKKFAHKTSLMSHIRQEHHLFDDIDEIKQGFAAKYASSPSPSDFDTRSPINHSSFSPGIPTPHSSLDSMAGLHNHHQHMQHQLMRPDYVPMPHSHYLPHSNSYPPPSPSEMSDISKLTATVEAATMGSGHLLPPRSFSSSSASSS